jgi:hypothetical protein
VIGKTPVDAPVSTVLLTTTIVCVPSCASPPHHQVLSRHVSTNEIALRDVRKEHLVDFLGRFQCNDRIPKTPMGKNLALVRLHKKNALLSPSYFVQMWILPEISGRERYAVVKRLEAQETTLADLRERTEARMEARCAAMDLDSLAVRLRERRWASGFLPFRTESNFL